MSTIDYFVTIEPDATEMHVVHAETCANLPDEDDMEELGSHADCEEALEAAAEAVDGPVNGCAVCCPDCHEEVEMGYDVDSDLVDDDD